MKFYRISFGEQDISTLLNSNYDTEELPSELNSIKEWVRSETNDEVVFLSEKGYEICQTSGLFKWCESKTGRMPDFANWTQKPVGIIYEDENQISIQNDVSLITFKSTFQKIALLMMPELLKGEYKSGKMVRTDRKIIEKYFNAFSRVNIALEKVLRYRTYFELFYPSKDEFNISKHEALEHHIHAFLQDIYVLREKVLTLHDEVSKDVRLIAINKKEVDEALKSFRKKIKNSFESASAARNQHTHGNKSFIDSNITTATALDLMLNGPMPDEWNKEKATELFTKKREEAFEKAKIDWVTKANDISMNCVGLVELVSTRNKEFIKNIFFGDELD